MSSPESHSHCHCGCCASMDRREFMTAVGASALAINATAMALEEASGPPPTPAQPRVRAAFLNPKTEKYWMGWPGASYDIRARQADYTNTMTDAAKKLGVDLQVDSEPVVDLAGVDRLAAQCKQSRPDGVILIVGGLAPNYWPHAELFLAKRGEIPTIVFSPMGTSFTGNLQPSRKATRCFVAATQDYGWLATGVRMLWTISQMDNTRLCIVNGEKTYDERLAGIGTTLHHVPLQRWTDELVKIKESAEVKALAHEFTRTAKKTVEPNAQDVLNSAKNYFVAKRIMAAENCQGISLNCLGLIGERKIPCPPCMAWLKLNDELTPGICECDWNAGIGQRLCQLLIGRPGFQQDPAPNTVNNTLMGAHCSGPTKLGGPDQPAVPMILRSHSESGLGVSPQVLWPEGEAITVMTFQGPKTILVGTGHVVANIGTPPSGGCRTSAEFHIDNVPDSRDCKGFHQLFLLGRHERLLQAYAQLAGLECGAIA